MSNLVVQVDSILFLKLVFKSMLSSLFKISTRILAANASINFHFCFAMCIRMQRSLVCRYTTEVLENARSLTEHSAKKQIDEDDIQSALDEADGLRKFQ